MAIYNDSKTLLHCPAEPGRVFGIFDLHTHPCSSLSSTRWNGLSEGWIWVPLPAISFWSSLGTCRGDLSPLNTSPPNITSKTCWRKEPLIMGLQWQGLQTPSDLFMQNTTFGRLLFALFSPKLSSLWSEASVASCNILLQLSQAQLQMYPPNILLAPWTTNIHSSGNT